MTTTAAEPLDTHGEMSGMAYKPAAPAASMRATHEPQLTTTRRVLIRGRPISNWLGMYVLCFACKEEREVSGYFYVMHTVSL